MITLIILTGSTIMNVALLTLAERHLMAACQRRIGPNQVGIIGILQPIQDGLKLIIKEIVIPLESNSQLFILTPYITFGLALLNWIFLPLNNNIYIIESLAGGILILIAISELGIYGIIFSGWAANSKYPFIGAIRSTAQMISYSVTQSLIILIVVLTVGNINYNEILLAQLHISLLLPLLPLALIFLITAIAETNRAPFDLPEAESELVSGFQTEHSSVAFAYFFLAEYTNIITISTLFLILFCGNTYFLFPLLFFFIWIRASLARLRFDQLMKFGWTELLIFCIGYLMFLPPFLILIA